SSAARWKELATQYAITWKRSSKLAEQHNECSQLAVEQPASCGNKLLAKSSGQNRSSASTPSVPVWVWHFLQPRCSPIQTSNAGTPFCIKHNPSKIRCTKPDTNNSELCILQRRISSTICPGNNSGQRQ